jgi:hypothetical protein
MAWIKIANRAERIKVENLATQLSAHADESGQYVVKGRISKLVLNPLALAKRFAAGRIWFKATDGVTKSVYVVCSLEEDTRGNQYVAMFKDRNSTFVPKLVDGDWKVFDRILYNILRIKLFPALFNEEFEFGEYVASSNDKGGGSEGRVTTPHHQTFQVGKRGCENFKGGDVYNSKIEDGIRAKRICPNCEDKETCALASELWSNKITKFVGAAQ